MMSNNTIRQHCSLRNLLKKKNNLFYGMIRTMRGKASNEKEHTHSYLLSPSPYQKWLVFWFSAQLLNHCAHTHAQADCNLQPALLQWHTAKKSNKTESILKTHPTHSSCVRRTLRISFPKLKKVWPYTRGLSIKEDASKNIGIKNFFKKRVYGTFSSQRFFLYFPHCFLALTLIVSSCYNTENGKLAMQST